MPRWVGDTNFMTAVAGTRVLPETLADTWERLHRGLAGLTRAPAERTAAGHTIGADPESNRRRRRSLDTDETKKEEVAMEVKELGHLVLYVGDVRAVGGVLRRRPGLGAGLPRPPSGSRRPPSPRGGPTTSCC